MVTKLPDLKFDHEYEISLQGASIIGRFRSFTCEDLACFYVHDDEHGMSVVSVPIRAIVRHIGLDTCALAPTTLVRNSTKALDDSKGASQ